eukprot:scaffold32638_cov112-Isochrysis_galbana.AAC.3
MQASRSIRSDPKLHSSPLVQAESLVPGSLMCGTRNWAFGNAVQRWSAARTFATPTAPAAGSACPEFALIAPMGSADCDRR